MGGVVEVEVVEKTAGGAQGDPSTTAFVRRGRVSWLDPIGDTTSRDATSSSAGAAFAAAFWGALALRDTEATGARDDARGAEASGASTIMLVY